MTFDLVIFDFDGTLADSADGIAACMQAAFERCHLDPPSVPEVRKRIGIPLEEAIRQLSSHHRDVDVPAVVDRYRELYSSLAAPRTTLYRGAGEALSLLDDAGVSLAVVSQKVRRGLTQLLERFDIERHFDLVLGSDEVMAAKPNPALYHRHIVDRFSIAAPDRVLVVGDTDIDLRFASNIGAVSCWAEYGYGHPASCRALEPAFTINEIGAVVRACCL